MDAVPPIYIVYAFLFCALATLGGYLIGRAVDWWKARG